MTTSIASFYYDTMMIVLWREIILFRNTNWKQKEILNSLTKRVKVVSFTTLRAKRALFTLTQRNSIGQKFIEKCQNIQFGEF